MKRKKTLLQCVLFLLSLFFLTKSLPAQEKTRLFASLVNSKGYVAGAKLSPSGLHVFEGDTTWRLIGWRHPRVSAAAFHPNDTNIIYLACGNGCLKSKDSGKSWKITTGWQVTESQSICVDPNAPQNVYLATAYGVWRSSDFGESWTESNNGLVKKYTQVVAVDRQQAGRVFAGTEGGLFVSADGANSWSLASAKDMAVLDLQQGVSDPKVWLAGTQEEGVLLSNDNGKSWRKTNGLISRASIYSVSIDPFNTQNMAAGGWDTGVFTSRDGGESWQQHKSGLSVDDVYSLIFDANTPGYLWVATVEKGIFKSPDFGQSWEFKGMYGSLVFDLIFVEGK
ncbi:MAG: WD40/YVTN/BNR-like repeat-containing protein [bacterium]